MKKAVVLLSGGLDSATTLAIARNQQFACYALSVHYGQRHQSELIAAQHIARQLQAREHRLVTVDLSVFGGSALTDKSIAVPTNDAVKNTIPITYVPARNTIMLSLALAWAETLACQDIFIGINAIDYSGYPDCRPEYITAFEKMANLATKAATEGKKITLHTPLIHLSKSDIIHTGIALGIEYGATISCYQADESGQACGHCDSCRIRKAGFAAAGIADPTRYRV
ncbi:MAG: 7-cyano-7-deazaguanine synthase QueC [Nitrosomonas sp.]|jgi:7-cyano-7-deazaguanine synthase